MSHFAEIDEDNKVLRVLVGDPSISDEDALNFMYSAFGGNWLQTSYNTFAGKHRAGGIPFRKNYAGVGMIYDHGRDAFLYQQPYPSWILNEDTCLWEPPVEHPSDGKTYEWNEDSISWVDKEIN
jgi:hypothetical protein